MAKQKGFRLHISGCRLLLAGGYWQGGSSTEKVSQAPTSMITVKPTAGPFNDTPSDLQTKGPVGV